MCNVDRWQGPLPQSWIDGQAELQKRILKRERELNMKPVLPAFSGHIPRELAGVVDQPLDTSQVARWGNFSQERRCTFLSPMDPMFSRIQKDFLEEQTRMYGTSHIYGLDSFNEVARDRFTAAYYAGDREGMTAARDEFLSICDSLVAVLKTRPEFSLEKWISAGRLRCRRTFHKHALPEKTHPGAGSLPARHGLR